jgi:hypothetical protein
MAQQRSGAADERELAQLTKDVERWRQTRAKLAPMPAPLWDEAIALARRMGVNPVKAALGLNYTALRTRLNAARREVALPAPTRFVELSGAQVMGLPSAAPGSVLEFSDAHGTRLTVRLMAGADVDVSRLVEAFRRRTA